MPDIHILVIEDDPGSQSHIQTMLDSEGWRLSVVADAAAALQELARGHWALVIASVAVTGVSGPAFTILKELATAAPVEGGRSRVRVLFTIPADLPTQAIPVLDADRLPYVMKPFQFNDFTEKINDLLVMAKFITRTARDRGFALQQERKKATQKPKKAAQSSSMFASRDEYYYTEEELAEYEREQEEEKKKKKLKQRPI